MVESLGNFKQNDSSSIRLTTIYVTVKRLGSLTKQHRKVRCGGFISKVTKYKSKQKKKNKTKDLEK